MPNPGQELATIDFESAIGGPLTAVVNAQAQAAMATVNFIKEVGFKKVSDEQNPEAAETGEPIYVTFKYPKEIAPYQPAVEGGKVSKITVTTQGSGYTSAPVVTIPDPPSGGTTATATATIESGSVVGIVLTNPGSGYSSAPTPSIGVAPEGGTRATATATITEDQEAQPAQIQDMKLEVPILTIIPIPFIRVDLATVDFNAKINSVEYRKTDTNFKIDASLSAKAGWLWGSAKLKVSTSYQKNTQQGETVKRTYSMGVHVKALQDEIPPGMERVLGILEDAIKGKPISEYEETHV
jgi:hypothetical protein